MKVVKVALQQQHDDTFADKIKGRILKGAQCFKVHRPVKHLHQSRRTLPWRLTGQRGRRRPIVLSCCRTSDGTQGRADVHFLLGREKWRSTRAAERTGALEASSSANGVARPKRSVPSLECCWAASPNIYALTPQTGSFIRQIKELLHSPHFYPPKWKQTASSSV